MSDRGIFIERNGHRCWLKWHRGHRRAGDISFTRQRLVEGLVLGASLEIDLVRFAGPGLVVLHDPDLDRATTGRGPVLAAGADELRSLYLRDHAGRPTDQPVMLIEDLGRLIAETPHGEGAVIQLDLKEGAASLRPEDVAVFAAAMGPVRETVILSGGDAAAVERLSTEIPGLPLGYDPCHSGKAERTIAQGNYADFVREAVDACPKAEMIYLEYPLILAAHEAGFDLVAAFHAEDRRIDAYTIRQAGAAELAAVERLLALKVDQITTDDPEGLQALIER